MEILCEVYPNHPWATRVDGGIVFIRHLELGSNWGMVRKFKDLRHDATSFKKEIIMAAGEFLERAGLVRGPGRDEPILRVEGIPEPKKAKFEQTVVMEDLNPLRSTPRPQAVK